VIGIGTGVGLRTQGGIGLAGCETARTMTLEPTVRLAKLHGLGNDFLVHLTDDASQLDALDGWSERAWRWCDRTHGVGADGLVLGVRGTADADLVMVLHNANGSRAEMSGNGIRCLVHAEGRRAGVDAGRWVVATDGGERTVDLTADPEEDPNTAVAAVDMGAVGPGPIATTLVRIAGIDPLQLDDPVVQRRFALQPKEAATYELGNPHLVLLVDDPEGVEIGRVGPAWEDCFPDGINVHAVAPTRHESDAMTMVIWERGVGPTAACGTGATAVAFAANEWGLVGDRVTVHMPGGDVVVDVGDTMVLHGPSVFIADVEVPA
jgi:diaminopimelate epimerase